MFCNVEVRVHASWEGNREVEVEPKPGREDVHLTRRSKLRRVITCLPYIDLMTDGNYVLTFFFQTPLQLHFLSNGVVSLRLFSSTYYATALMSLEHPPNRKLTMLKQHYPLFLDRIQPLVDVSWTA